MFLIVRQVRTFGKHAPVKEKVYVTFWTGGENGFGCRKFAKTYATPDEASDATYDVASYYFAKMSSFRGSNEVEIVQEVSPGLYKAPELSDW
jgi:hypothetical protein